jgi:methyl-accepting chemotaxis protein
MESIRQDADRIRQSADQIRREADLIRQDADQIRRDAEIVGDKMNVDIGELVKQLREEGLTDTSDSVNSIKLTNDTLKINGKQASDEAHARFLELYQAETGSKLRGKFTVEIKQ